MDNISVEPYIYWRRIENELLIGWCWSANTLLNVLIWIASILSKEARISQMYGACYPTYKMTLFLCLLLEKKKFIHIRHPKTLWA